MQLACGWGKFTCLKFQAYSVGKASSFVFGYEPPSATSLYQHTEQAAPPQHTSQLHCMPLCLLHQTSHNNLLTISFTASNQVSVEEQAEKALLHTGSAGPTNTQTVLQTVLCAAASNRQDSTA